MMCVIAWFLVKLEHSLTSWKKHIFGLHISIKNITIAELMILQSMFGIPLTTDIIAKVSSSNVTKSLREIIWQKIKFVKSGRSISKDI